MERTLSRRNIVLGGIAGGSFLPVTASTTAVLPADPVATLGEVRRAAYAHAEALAIALDKRSDDDSPEHRAADAAVSEAWDAVREVEDRMAGMIANTAAGISAQAETLRDFLAITDAELMLDRIIAGLARLSQGGGA